jgi:hypothetical protein
VTAAGYNTFPLCLTPVSACFLISSLQVYFIMRHLSMDIRE